jgi:hypothetical protein
MTELTGLLRARETLTPEKPKMKYFRASRAATEYIYRNPAAAQKAPVLPASKAQSALSARWI